VNTIDLGKKIIAAAKLAIDSEPLVLKKVTNVCRNEGIKDLSKCKNFAVYSMEKQ
jgi:hypothetical protein